MTREELINFGEMFLEVNRDSKNSNTYEFIKKSIELLKQEPCGDCVNRKSVNELFDSEIKMYKERIEIRKGSCYHDETERIREFRSRIANAEYWQNKIKDLPPVTSTQNWILTSERQPEENGNYLAIYRTSDGTASMEFMMVDHCNAGGCWLHEENGRKTYKKVIAWMPLPEPFSEGEYDSN